MKYSYEEFLQDLDMGREIHFIYKNQHYYIGGQFMFWRFYDSSSEVKGDNVKDLLQKVLLDGKPIQQIWDLIEIDVIF